MIDIVIPTYKPETDFFTLLASLFLQSEEIGKIIIMNTQELYWMESMNQERMGFLGMHPNIEIYHVSKEEFDHGNTRNIGFSHCSAPIVVCMTQDVIIVEKDMLKSLIKPFQEEIAVAICYARQLPKENCSDTEKFTRAFNYPKVSQIKGKEDISALGIKTFFCSNVCAAYRMTTYVQIGGFLPKTIFNEDMIFAATAVKMGYKIAYVAEARVIHSHTYTNKQQFKRNFDLGVSHADHKEIFGGVAVKGEGIQLVKSSAKYLREINKRRKIIPMYITSAYKYAGFIMGKAYKKLPTSLVKKWSMNKAYWSL